MSEANRQRFPFPRPRKGIFPRDPSGHRSDELGAGPRQISSKNVSMEFGDLAISAKTIGKESQQIIECSQKVAEITEDGILCSILSLLKMKDAVRTSVLSRRWKKLWTYIPNLNFNATNLLEVDRVLPTYADLFSRVISTDQEAMLLERRNKFIRSVNEFLHHHRGSGVNLFNVAFDLDEKDAHQLNKWVEFAIGSGAKELALHLHDSQRGSIKTNPFDFPFHLFDGGRGSLIESLCLSSCNLNPHATFIGFGYLKRLSSGRLKMLSVHGCRGLTTIKLDSTCLTLFEYVGHWMAFCLKNASRVVNAEIMMDDLGFATKSYIEKLASDLPELEALSLRNQGPAEVGMLTTSYRFTHLKQLFLRTERSQDFDARALALFLNAAPLLEKFHVHIYGPWPWYRASHCLRIPDSTHSKLRQFEFGGFDGKKDETELILYVLRNAAALELVTVDPCPWAYSFRHGWMKLGGVAELAEYLRFNAYRQLSVMAVPRGVSLVTCPMMPTYSSLKRLGRKVST